MKVYECSGGWVSGKKGVGLKQGREMEGLKVNEYTRITGQSKPSSENQEECSDVGPQHNVV